MAGGCILQWTMIKVIVAIFLGFDKCSYMQFLILVEYNKKGLVYVKLNMKYMNIKKNQNRECSISNGFYNIGEVECHELSNLGYGLLSH